MTQQVRDRDAEIERLRAERDRFRDGMLTLGTELRAIEAALDDERINLTHTSAQVAAEMRDKINELHAEIVRQKARYALLEESYSLLRAEIESMKRQKPAAWMCPDDPDSATAFSWGPGVCKTECCRKQMVPLYLAPGAQTAQ